MDLIAVSSAPLQSTTAWPGPCQQERANCRLTRSKSAACMTILRRFFFGENLYCTSARGIEFTQLSCPAAAMTCTGPQHPKLGPQGQDPGWRLHPHANLIQIMTADKALATHVPSSLSSHHISGTGDPYNPIKIHPSLMFHDLAPGYSTSL
jgi:hypothetical protein